MSKINLIRLFLLTFVLCSTNSQLIASEFKCNIKNYILAGQKLETLKSWIPEHFTISEKEHARVGYEGKEVTYFNESSSKFTYQIHIKQKDKSGRQFLDRYMISVSKDNLKVSYTIASTGYKPLRAHGVCKALSAKNNTVQSSPKKKVIVKVPVQNVFNEFSLRIRKMIQENLFLLGNYKSTIDGKWGKNTAAAIEMYAIENDMTPKLKTDAGAREVIKAIVAR